MGKHKLFFFSSPQVASPMSQGSHVLYHVCENMRFGFCCRSDLFFHVEDRDHLCGCCMPFLSYGTHRRAQYISNLCVGFVSLEVKRSNGVGPTSREAFLPAPFSQIEIQIGCPAMNSYRVYYSTLKCTNVSPWGADWYRASPVGSLQIHFSSSGYLHRCRLGKDACSRNKATSAVRALLNTYCTKERNETIVSQYIGTHLFGFRGSPKISPCSGNVPFSWLKPVVPLFLYERD